MKQLVLFVFIFIIPLISFSQANDTFTHRLVSDFHKAWNDEDLDRMENLLDKDAFFKSPFQLRYSRDTMMNTVLRKNPKIFKVSEIIETHSRVNGNQAWSIGKMTSDMYNSAGNKTGKQWHNDYVYLFIRDEKGDWKLQMLLYHE